MRPLKLLFPILCAAAVLLGGCSAGGMSESALLERVREELTIYDAETVELRNAGAVKTDGKALFWFVTGNENQAHTYLAVECEVVGEEQYRFVKSYESMDRGEEIGVVNWNGGYCFYNNNPDCRALWYSEPTADGEGKETTVPFVDETIIYLPFIPSEYEFLDTSNDPL